ncbi:hypothetical protein J2X69_003867 [Algoriphagus sp. 4150]|uniref:hypothetical protein n=1 Tax=Algoriphagus sp. 4150 TaxID=2817756 RepID=UPI0028675E65|nr:hypothetical protein [Algoriphagus sp. 4150]MDR7131503.1 hypothetical protein [Algoriphagus sp. 4150]
MKLKQRVATLDFSISQMKSSMTQESHGGMIICEARFHPVSFVTGQVMTAENQIINR